MVGFFLAGTRVGHVPSWILVTQTLGAPGLVGMPLWGFLRASIPCSTFPLAGVAAWIGAGGEVGASDGMVRFPLWEGFSVVSGMSSGTKELW